jgi:acetate kinase
VSVKTTGVRGVILENVLCRVNPNYTLEFHIDTDEANASGLRTGDMVQIIALDGYHEMHTFVKKRVLVLNFGSSSVKYKLFDMPSEKIVRQGKAELPSDVDKIFEQAGTASCTGPICFNRQR